MRQAPVALDRTPLGIDIRAVFFTVLTVKPLTLLRLGRQALGHAKKDRQHHLSLCGVARLFAVLARLDDLSAIPAANLANHPREVPLAVLDSNVVFDVWYWNDKDAQALKTAILEKRLQLVSTPSCLKEFAVVLNRPQFKLSESEQDRLLENVLSHVTVARSSVEGMVRCRDTDDEKFLNLAFETRADFLFTKDKTVLRAGRRLVSLGTKTMKPAEFNGLHLASELS